jgi:hypothetical protein
MLWTQNTGPITVTLLLALICAHSFLYLPLHHHSLPDLSNQLWGE